MRGLLSAMQGIRRERETSGASEPLLANSATRPPMVRALLDRRDSMLAPLQYVVL